MPFSRFPDNPVRCCGNLQHIESSPGRENPWRRLVFRSLVTFIDYGTIAAILPQFYTSIHQSAVRAVTWVRVPPSSASGRPIWDEDPVIIATGGYDGAQCYIDLRDGTMNEFNRTRGVFHRARYRSSD